MPKILIVDDDDNNRAVMFDALDGDGFDLVEAIDGEDALQKAVEEQPDLILLDVLMPGIDGLETLRRLKADSETAEIPVIMVTALNMDSQVAVCLDEGAVDHISKPFSNMVLRARVRAAMRTACSDTRSPKSRHKTIVFMGAKGGVGTTTVAVNVGAKLASSGKDVVFCELNSGRGTAASLLNLPTDRHLGKIVDAESGQLRAVEIPAQLNRHPSGLRVLLSPADALEQDQLNAEQAVELLNRVGEDAEYVLVDLPNYLTNHTEAVLRAVDAIVLVVELEPTSLVAAEKVRSQFERWGIAGCAQAVITSRANVSSCPIKLNELRGSLQFEIIGVVPPAPDAFMRSAHDGVPVVMSRLESTAIGALNALSNRLVTVQASALCV